jgi:outer membrane protein assembly factor BamE
MKKNFLSILCVLLLVACQTNVPFAYKMDIQQGNILEPEEVEQIQVGMTKSQVDELLGMPISRDTFKHDRWVFVYSLKKNHEPVELRHLTLYFDRQGTVERIEFDETEMKEKSPA